MTGLPLVYTTSWAAMHAWNERSRLRDYNPCSMGPWTLITLMFMLLYIQTTVTQMRKEKEEGGKEKGGTGGKEEGG